MLGVYHAINRFWDGLLGEKCDMAIGYGYHTLHIEHCSIKLLTTKAVSQ